MAERARVALVIGNSAYASASILKNPANDARDIASAFARIGFSGISTDDSPSEYRAVVPMLDLDHRQLREAIAAFARAADGAEQAVMYYAGHGIEVGGQNYLVPVDANLRKITDVGFQTVSLNELLDALGGVDSRDSLLGANQIQGCFWGGSLGCDGTVGFERRGVGADSAADHRPA